MSQAGINSVSNVKPTVVETLTGNTGGPVGPNASNNINLLGAILYTLSGNPGTNTLTVNPLPNAFPITPYVVGPVGQAGYQTIQSAINAANSAGGGAIYVQPGIYTENLTLFSNTQVAAAAGASDIGGGVTIIGIHTPPTSGNFTFTSVILQSATHIFSSNASGSTTLFVTDCLINITNGYIFNLPSWTGSLITYNVGEASTNNGVVNNSGGSTCFFLSATHGAGNLNAMLTSGLVILEEIDLNCPWNASTGTNLACDYVIFTQTITLSSNSTGAFNWCRFSTGSVPAIIMSTSGPISLYNSIINSSNNPVITGSGTGALTIADITFVNNRNIASTVALNYNFNVSPLLLNYNSTNSGSSPYTAIPTDHYISVNTLGGPVTILLPNVPSIGRDFIVKDNSGSASTNNISIRTISGGVTIDGVTTYKLTANYESVQLIFNGTSYEVF